MKKEEASISEEVKSDLLLKHKVSLKSKKPMQALETEIIKCSERKKKNIWY